VVSLPGGKLWREMKVEEKAKKKKVEEEEEEEGGGEEEEEESRNYPSTLSLFPFHSPWAEMMYGCKGHMLAV